jgi:hypothetical protein
MKEVFDDQVLEEWGVKDWKEVALNELEMPEFMRVNWFKGGKAAWELIKTFTPKTQELLKRLNTYKEQLFARNNAPKGNTTLKAAEQELKSNQIDLAKQRGVTYNHVKKVEQAQEGLEKLIENINNRLGFPNLSDLERKALQEELAKASKLLDHTKQFVPRQK